MFIIHLILSSISWVCHWIQNGGIVPTEMYQHPSYSIRIDNQNILLDGVTMADPALDVPSQLNPCLSTRAKELGPRSLADIKHGKSN